MRNRLLIGLYALGVAIVTGACLWLMVVNLQVGMHPVLAAIPLVLAIGGAIVPWLPRRR